MPFTFSHPAIILPLTYLPKRWFSLTGLIIGSLMPDFEYFLRMKIKSDFSHTLEGVFLFDLPLGILTAFIFHNIVRNNLFDNLPIFLKSRLVIFKDFNWNIYFKKNWLIVIFSIIIGTFSHILWDSFTHDTGYFVQKIEILNQSVDLFDKQIPILKILQHSSTFFGAVVIVFSLYKLPKYQVYSKSINLNYWFAFFIFFIILLSTFLVTTSAKFAIGNLIVSIISKSMIALILTSLLVKTKPKKFI
ncbi:protein of unknown function [Paenimyroides ummariense]|uniref:DUF4184 family protein n=1 Tax=Paenimyroides ummariense TaxID=913024 RepID=A0A1I4ZWL5_9FLAO|nr:DUF4184 family protein [Paenimyroides ummariense]SFN54612.1 protein of unknown function [Paenimyroides ummariense]